jgi:hypothetical protein
MNNKRKKVGWGWGVLLPQVTSMSGAVTTMATDKRVKEQRTGR